MRNFGLILAALAASASLSAQVKTIHSSDMGEAFKLSSGADAFVIEYNAPTTRGGQGGGFMIKATSKNVPEIIGYSESGYFDPENIPDNMKTWLQGYVKEAEYADRLAARGVSLKSASTRAVGSVEPFVQTKWDQGKPFNDLAPLVDGKSTWSGCTAAATAQCMALYKFPDVGEGTADFVTTTNQLHITGDLRDYPLEWDKTLLEYKSWGEDAYTQQDAEVISKIYYSIDLAIKMDFDPNGSGAYLIDASRALVQNYGYDKEIMYLHRYYFSDNDWHYIITNELKHKRPLIYEGFGNSGHAFVFDGYQTREDDIYYHVNWGWGGSADGYFRLNALEPFGASNEGYKFNESQGAVIGIQPENNTCDFECFLSLSKYTADDIIIAGESENINIELGYIDNQAKNPFTGELLYYLTNEKDTILLGSQTIDTPIEILSYWVEPQNFNLPKELPLGEFKLDVVARSAQFSQDYNVFIMQSSTILITDQKPAFEPHVSADGMYVYSNYPYPLVHITNIVNRDEGPFNGYIVLNITDDEGNPLADIPSREYRFSANEYFNNGQLYEPLNDVYLPDGIYRLTAAVYKKNTVGTAPLTRCRFITRNEIEDSKEPLSCRFEIKDGRVGDVEQHLPIVDVRFGKIDYEVKGDHSISISLKDIYNHSIDGFTGLLGYAIFDKDSTVVYRNAYYSVALCPNYGYTSLQMSSANIPDNLEDGEYKLYLQAQNYGMSDWCNVTKHAYYAETEEYKADEYYISFTVSGGIVTFGEVVSIDAPTVDALAKEKTITGIFTLDGRKVNKMTSGMYVIRYSDGSSKIANIH